MRLERKDPPRRFVVGFGEQIELSDCGIVHLEPNEQVTFVTPDGAEYDLTRKAWGFYATPSLNSRLIGFGLRGVLVKNRQGRFFTLLVEQGHEDAFWRYMKVEELVVVSWLHEEDSLSRLERLQAEPLAGTPDIRCMCMAPRFRTRFEYDSPPPGENVFEQPPGSSYGRRMDECLTCGHFVAVSEMGLAAAYDGAYVDAAYGSSGLQQSFDRIMQLPPDRSDNRGRVEHVKRFVDDRLGLTRPALLDVGSGLGVFPYAMKEIGWDVTALDPDPRAAEHCRSLGLSVHSGDFFDLDSAELGRYDVVTFNKVLEHVADPVAMLAKGASLLRDRGVLYVEVPDGEVAALDGSAREEFFIEHLHVFSFASLGLLAMRAKTTVLRVERLQEPSSKYTLRAFLKKED